MTSSISALIKADKFLQLANTVVVLEDSRISASGKLESLLAQGGYIAHFDPKNEDNNSQTEVYVSPHSENETSLQEHRVNDQTSRDPFRRHGDWAVYKYYAHASGYRAVLLFLLSLFIVVGIYEFQSKLVFPSKT